MANLAEKTYWKVGGICNNFNEIENLEELSSYLKNNSFPIVIGNGTNILFDSDGFDGSVIRLGSDFDFINIEKNSNIISVGASVWVPGLVKYLSKKGFGGLDHCIGIPATIGGLVTMNGGSNRQSVSEIIEEVTYLDEMGNIKSILGSECEFGYRESIFKKNKSIIISIKIKLDIIERNSNRMNLINILKSRRLKFPRKTPNCGSVFMSSPALFDKVGAPGFIIQSLGLKGARVGDAQISEQHANFILNIGNATSGDIIALVRLINEKCYSKYGLKMKTEVIFYSKNGQANQLDDV